MSPEVASLQIKRFIAWPHSERLPVRVIEFEVGGVTVVDDSSGAVGLAMWACLDYCLGASSCRVPHGEIKRECSWVGVELVSLKQSYLLARRLPTAGGDVSNVMIERGASIKVPKLPRKNATIARLHATLKSLLGYDLETPPFGRLSFRDLLLLNYQPSYVLRNPSLLFFKESDDISVQKLRLALPQIMGLSGEPALKAQTVARLETEKAGLLRAGRELRMETDQYKARLQELYRSIVNGRSGGSAANGRNETAMELVRRLSKLRQQLPDRSGIQSGGVKASCADCYTAGELDGLLALTPMVEHLELLRQEYEMTELAIQREKNAVGELQQDDLLSESIMRHAKAFGIDSGGATPVLDLRSLSLFLKFDRQNQSLAILGSQPAVVGYHLATYLALQQGIAQGDPIGGLRTLIFDHPFDFSVDPSGTVAGGGFAEQVVTRCIEATEAVDGQLQVIILDSLSQPLPQELTLNRVTLSKSTWLEL